MAVKEIERKLVKYFREPNLFPKHKQSYDGRIKTFSKLVNRLSLKLGPVFDNYVDYVYNNGGDILFIYQILVIARRWKTASAETVINFAYTETIIDNHKKETDYNRLALAYTIDEDYYNQ